jgi:hypothetical protein
MAVAPPGLYGEAKTLIAGDPERATWISFLIAYLSPLQDGGDPFGGIRAALAAMPTLDAPIATELLSDPGAIALGPRSSHDPARGGDTLLAYREWVQRYSATSGDEAVAAQVVAFSGDASWTPERRFERLFERLSLPGFGRMGRYELLVSLGRAGAYEMKADSLHLGGARGTPGEEPTVLAAKRVFGIGDPLLLDRRAGALAEAIAVPIETLDLALANWAAPSRATLGFASETRDEGAHERAVRALGL